MRKKTTTNNISDYSMSQAKFYRVRRTNNNEWFEIYYSYLLVSQGPICNNETDEEIIQDYLREEGA